MLHHNNTLAEVVSVLLEMLRTKESEVLLRNTRDAVKVKYIARCGDPTKSAIMSDLTRYAAELVIYELDQTVTELEMSGRTATAVKCDCLFYSSYELPCRHIFDERRKSGN